MIKRRLLKIWAQKELWLLKTNLILEHPITLNNFVVYERFLCDLKPGVYKYQQRKQISPIQRDTLISVIQKIKTIFKMIA